MSLEKSKYKKERQDMLAFAFLADLESSKEITTQKQAESGAAKRIKAFLKCDACTTSLGDWELSQNPIIYAKLPKGATKGMMSLNTTVILNSTDKKKFIIGVAGTNFISTYDWFVEDLEVSTQVPWDNNIIHYNTAAYQPSSVTDKGVVSKSTAIALSNTWNIKNANGKTFAELLKKSLPSKGDVTISVTGHSLGGAISPALAQALFDNQDDWKPSGLNVSISTYIFAGPTAGDKEWVRHVTKSLKRVSSTYNKHDIVPHAWKLNMIEEMRTLFEPNFPGTNVLGGNGIIADTLIDWIYSKSYKAESPYERWFSYWHLQEEEVFKGKLPCAAEYSDIMNEAKALQVIIEADWLYQTGPKQHLEALNAICKVCNIDTTSLNTKQKVAALKPYLLYFCQFISILGDEHIQQYHNWMNNAFLTCSMKYYLNMGTSSLFALKGVGVIYELFLALGAFVESRS